MLLMFCRVFCNTGYYYCSTYDWFLSGWRDAADVLQGVL